ncbi:hypothetical protein INT46_010702 [Mucor plumbeus]|uniref:Required for respiratory growth protein 9, mitochondrial n=1 Tax=Mucor plumbeus TaxID=97098 RepID=A0A8H7QEA0_9FUNG|nr:hypothetical protein INT46_010702 [Mucor plumbeus]
MFKSIFRLKPVNTRLFSTETGKATTVAPNWAPKKRVSRPTMEKIRALAASQPEVYNVVTLSREFKLSVEGVRRILKSRYIPKAQDGERQEKNRYEAMGERRKEFKKTYNIPEENPKKFWNKNTTENVQDISSRRGERGSNSNWSNAMYKSRSFEGNDDNFGDRRSKIVNEGSRPHRSFGDQEERRPYNGNRQRNFDRDESRSHSYDQPRRNSYRNDQLERRPYNGDHQRSFDNDRSFNSERKPFKKDFDRFDGERKSFRSDNDDGERKPFRRDNSNGERRSFGRASYDNERNPFKKYKEDAERRPYRRFSDDQEKRPFNDKKPFRRSNNDDQERRSFNRQTRDNNNAAGDRRFKRDSYKKEQHDDTK